LEYFEKELTKMKASPPYIPCIVAIAGLSAAGIFFCYSVVGFGLEGYLALFSIASGLGLIIASIFVFSSYSKQKEKT
jgi:hypothetical protein